MVFRFVHDSVGLVAGDVEIDLAGGLLALLEGGRVDALRGGNLVQGSVRLAARGSSVEIRHDRRHGAFDRFVGCGGFPESALYRVRDGVGAGLKVADGPSLNDVAVHKACLGAQSVGRSIGGFVGGGGRCAGNADDSRGEERGC